MKSSVAYINDLNRDLGDIKHAINSEFEVKTFDGPRSLLNDCFASSFVCIISDFRSSPLDNFDLYEKVVSHPHYNGCPLLFIAPESSGMMDLDSHSLGAVDYIKSEVNPDELIQKIKSKIAFFKQQKCFVSLGNLMINLKLLRTYLDGKEVPMTFIELKLLYFILKAHPEYIFKESIVEKVWGDTHVLDATISTHISNLNNKLTDWSFEIESMKTKGFRIVRRCS